MSTLSIRAQTLKTTSLAISEAEDDPTIRSKYRPFILSPILSQDDWISKLELDSACQVAAEDIKKTGCRIKILVLYGSLRTR